MFQGEGGTGLGEHVDVVGQAQLVELREPLSRAAQVTQAQARQALLGDRAHDHEIRVAAQVLEQAVIGKRRVGLVHHHQAGGGLDHGLHVLAGKAVARGVVGIGQEHHRGLVLLHGPDEAIHIQGEVLAQGHAHVGHVRVAGDHAVHDEARLHGHHHPPGRGERHDDHLDQLVGAVAEDHGLVGGDAGDPAQGLDQLRRTGIRVAVQFHVTQLREPCIHQFRRPVVGVFHGIQFNEAGGVGDVIGGQGPDSGPDPLADQGVGVFHRVALT